MKLKRFGIEGEDLKRFFDRAWRLEILRSTDEQSPLPATAFSKKLDSAWQGDAQISTQEILPNKVVFAYSGGYVFENMGRIEVYAAGNTGDKPTPFGDIHDLANSQFKEDYGVNADGMLKSHRCLVLQTYDVVTKQIECQVLPVETMHSESGMRLGEVTTAESEKDFTDSQIAEASERYSVSSYEPVRFIVFDSNRREAINTLLTKMQLEKKLRERLETRLFAGVEQDESLREYLREEILYRSGVKTVFD